MGCVYAGHYGISMLMLQSYSVSAVIMVLGFHSVNIHCSTHHFDVLTMAAAGMYVYLSLSYSQNAYVQYYSYNEFTNLKFPIL